MYIYFGWSFLSQLHAAVQPLDEMGHFIVEVFKESLGRVEQVLKPDYFCH